LVHSCSIQRPPGRFVYILMGENISPHNHICCSSKVYQFIPIFIRFLMQSISSCIRMIIFFSTSFCIKVPKYHFNIMLGALTIDGFKFQIGFILFFIIFILYWGMYINYVIISEFSTDSDPAESVIDRFELPNI